VVAQFYEFEMPKGLAHCFSMQVVINKCFLLNLEKKFGVDPSCRFRKKKQKKNVTLIQKNDVIKAKARLYIKHHCNITIKLTGQLKDCFTDLQNFMPNF